MGDCVLHLRIDEDAVVDVGKIFGRFRVDVDVAGGLVDLQAIRGRVNFIRGLPAFSVIAPWPSID